MSLVMLEDRVRLSFVNAIGHIMFCTSESFWKVKYHYENYCQLLMVSLYLWNSLSSFEYTLLSFLLRHVDSRKRLGWKDYARKLLIVSHLPIFHIMHDHLEGLCIYLFWIKLHLLLKNIVLWEFLQTPKLYVKSNK